LRSRLVFVGGLSPFRGQAAFRHAHGKVNASKGRLQVGCHSAHSAPLRRSALKWFGLILTPSDAEI